jgi:hypothetical protein
MENPHEKNENGQNNPSMRGYQRAIVVAGESTVCVLPRSKVAPEENLRLDRMKRNRSQGEPDFPIRRKSDNGKGVFS